MREKPVKSATVTPGGVLQVAVAMLHDIVRHIGDAGEHRSALLRLRKSRVQQIQLVL